MKKILLCLAAAATMLTAYADETNLFSNGGFEQWADGKPANWTPASSAGGATLSQSTDAHSGSYSVQANSASGNKRLAYQETEYKAGTYVFSYYAKSVSADAQAVLVNGYVPVDADNKVGSYDYSKSVNTIPADAWTLVSDSITLAADTKACFVIRINKNTGNVLIDDATLTFTPAENSGENGGETPAGPDLTGVVSVAEAQAAEVGASVKVYGLVYAAGKGGFVLGDGSGYIYTYFNNHTYAVGDSLMIEGAVSEYGGFKQFKNDATFTKTASGKTVAYPEAVNLDGAAADAWFANPVIEYVSMTGTLAISGNYYNVTIEGATTAVGSLISPSADIAAKLTNGASVTVKGFAMYTSGGKYVNIVVTEVVSAGESNLKHIANTLETAYTTAQAIALIDDANNDLSDSVYVKGVVSRVQSFNSTYGSITYWLDDNTFEVYNGLGKNGEKFAAQTDLNVGDEVIVKGTITKYNTTYEFNQNSIIVQYKATGNVQELTDPTNTPETAYTTAKAIEMIDAGTYDLAKTVYVKGTVSKIDKVQSNTLIYWLDNDTFEVYKGKGLGGEDITSTDYLKVGDEVIVSGTITKYNTTYEFAANNVLYSVNGNTTTSLSEVEIAASKPQVIYNLLGQRVDAISGKGIYIINGKKVIVR
ncbi:MAG: hypothetical protein IJP70_03160 [Bacteroidales bacterium]|nr:hypothetical protein [Bacteroidales bacterium]